MNHFQFPSLFITLFFTLLLFPALSSASSVENTEYPRDTALRVQEKYDRMSSLSFAFTQRSSGQLSGRPKTGNGTAYFHKSGETSRMRWNYSDPDRQVLLSDGNTLKMYFAELHQMIITPAESLDNDLTYSFFSGKNTLEEKFHILPPDPEYMNDKQSDALLQTVKLVPKEPQSQVQSIHLWVSNDALIRRIEIRDHFDTITQLNLRDIAVDFLNGSPASEADTLFSFTPPEDTEIIRQ